MGLEPTTSTLRKQNGRSSTDPGEQFSQVRAFRGCQRIALNDGVRAMDAR
jgi:hypothetical protein